MKKEMTLGEVQNISLDILVHFHNFCIANNIKYSLGYGTLIGAIRHKGFIPWDDDVDVVMLREDYDRFVKLYQDDLNYKLFAPTRKNIYGACARLCEIRRTEVVPIAPMFTEKTGVWIDIFPLDIVADDFSRFEKAMNKIEHAHYNTLVKRCILGNGYQKVHGIRSLYAYLRQRCSYCRSISYYVNKHLSLIKQIQDPFGSMMAQFTYPTPGAIEYYPKSLFENVTEFPFEGKMLYVMDGYDRWLRTIYGDYMQLPPKEDQHRDHSDHKYYWID